MMSRTPMVRDSADVFKSTGREFLVLEHALHTSFTHADLLTQSSDRDRGAAALPRHRRYAVGKLGTGLPATREQWRVRPPTNDTSQSRVKEEPETGRRLMCSAHTAAHI